MVSGRTSNWPLIPEMRSSVIVPTGPSMLATLKGTPKGSAWT